MQAVASLDSLLAAQTLWHAGRHPATTRDGEPTGHAALDALLPQRGWPRRALTELLLPADGVGELALLMPTLARLSREGGTLALVAPPYLPYAPAWQAAGIDLGAFRSSKPRRAMRCGRSSNACAAVPARPWSAGHGRRMRRPCAACRWRRTAATASASCCATASTRRIRRRPRFGWNTTAMAGACANAAAARLPRARSRRACIGPRACCGPASCCRSWRWTPSSGVA